MGGKPTDASMILVSKPYKEMANSTRQKCLTDTVLKFFLQRFLKVDNYIQIWYTMYIGSVQKNEETVMVYSTQDTAITVVFVTQCMVTRDLIYRFGAFDQVQYVTDTTVSLVCTEADIAYMQNNFALEKFKQERSDYDSRIIQFYVVST